MLVPSLLSLLSTVYKYGDPNDFADRDIPEDLGNELLSMLAAAPCSIMICANQHRYW